MVCCFIPKFFVFFKVAYHHVKNFYVHVRKTQILDLFALSVVTLSSLSTEPTFASFQTQKNHFPPPTIEVHGKLFLSTIKRTIYKQDFYIATNKDRYVERGIASHH